MLLEKTFVKQPLMTVEQAAERLNMNAPTVRRFLRDGLLVGIKINQEWRIEPAELEQFIEKNKQTKKQ